MSEQPGLKREGTMAVTAQEGEAFLQSQGMAVTDDDAKTRAQKEKLQEITSTSDGQPEEENAEKPKITREGTMAVTAKEGQDLLGDEALEKTRGQTTALKEATKEEEKKEESPKKPRMPRESTMAVTAQEGAELIQGEELEKTRAQTAAKSPTTPTRVKRTTTIAQTAEASAAILGEEARGRTRSQTRKRSESEEKKPAVKRTSTMAQTAKEGEEFLQRETKRAKQEGEEEEGAGEGGEAATTAED